MSGCEGPGFQDEEGMSVQAPPPISLHRPAWIVGYTCKVNLPKGVDNCVCKKDK